MRAGLNWQAVMRTAMLAAAVGAALPGEAVAAQPKYYFRVGPVKAPDGVDATVKTFASEALRQELSSRPSWASDVGGAQGEAEGELVAELKKRGLRGFDVTLRLEQLKNELKEPNPGGHLKRLAVNVRLTVFGTAIPGAKLAFSGDGEAGLETEVTERRAEIEGASAIHDAIKDAIKQAVDQAEAKLSLGVAAPLNENKRRKK
jgi:hypothetical protein